MSIVLSPSPLLIFSPKIFSSIFFLQFFSPSHLLLVPFPGLIPSPELQVLGAVLDPPSARDRGQQGGSLPLATIGSHGESHLGAAPAENRPACAGFLW